MFCKEKSRVPSIICFVCHGESLASEGSSKLWNGYLPLTCAYVLLLISFTGGVTLPKAFSQLGSQADFCQCAPAKTHCVFIEDVSWTKFRDMISQRFQRDSTSDFIIIIIIIIRFHLYFSPLFLQIFRRRRCTRGYTDGGPKVSGVSGGGDSSVT